MHLRYYRKHALLRAVLAPSFLPKDGRDFYNTWLGKCDVPTGCVVAYQKGEVVGFFRFEDKDHGRRQHRPRVLWALGTWVSEKHRGKGLAYKMWVYALEKVQPWSVHVTVVSHGGRKLIESLYPAYPELEWDLDDLQGPQTGIWRGRWA